MDRQAPRPSLGSNLFILALMVTLLACGADDKSGIIFLDASNDGSKDGGTGRLSIEDLPAAIADALCPDPSPCASEAGFTDDCEALRPIVQTTYESYVEAVEAGTLVFDIDLAEACLMTIRETTCEERTERGWEGRATVAGACDGMLQGALTLGATCAPLRRTTCAQGYCQYDSLSCGGTCVEPAQEGASCEGNASSRLQDSKSRLCAEGLLCTQELCRVPAELGASCSASAPCAAHLFCDASGLCAARAELGMPCDNQSTPCKSSLRCSGGSCVSNLGGSCRDAPECASAECIDKICQKAQLGQSCSCSNCCDNYLTCSNGTCRAHYLLQEGEACAWQDACAMNLGCDCVPDPTGACTEPSICAALRTDNEKCNYAEMCESRWCSSGICQPQAARGTACSYDSQCGNWLACVDGACQYIATFPFRDCEEDSERYMNGFCLPKRTLQSPCQQSAECLSGNCFQSLCSPPRTDGQSCTSSSECASSLYCDLSQQLPTCTAIVNKGESCTSSFGCAEGLTCDTEQSVCVEACL